ncbi:MAG: class I SAM-dependent methyltransferase [Thermoplasmata archaeon]|nr:MAG: class I SAM-dependent methyltransferase [Thermoplasmata archaeon]
MGRRKMNKAGCKTTRERVNQHYEEQWQGYTEEDVLKRVNNLSEVLDSIISPLILKQGARILDLGSGPGIIPIRIAQIFNKNLGIRSCGIDISEKALNLGNRFIKKRGLAQSIQLIKADCENLPFKNDTYDAVVSNATINLLLHKENGFSEIVRVTKNKGDVIIADCLAREGKTCDRDTESDDDLWSACVAGAPTKKEIHKYADEVGMEVISTKNLTDEVTRLVKSRLWDWPEFLEHDLEYFVFKIKKRE